MAVNNKKTENEKGTVNEKKPVRIKPMNDPDELVRVYIPRVPGEEDSFWCGVNGKHYLIRRGEDVMVPRCVMGVIRDSEYAEDVRIAKLREAEARFKENK